MNWRIQNNSLQQQDLLINESLFSLGNGYLGVRGNFEEGYAAGMNSIRGTYINAFHDVIEIPYGEKLYGFPDTQQKLVNIIDSQGVEIFLGDDEERFHLFEGEVISYERNLHMDKGYSERLIHWRSPGGKEIKLHVRRIVSFVTRELFAIDIQIEPVTFHGPVKIVSTVKGDVTNYTDPKDPRVASGHAKLLQVIDTRVSDKYSIVVDRTLTSKLEAACVTSHEVNVPCESRVDVTESNVSTEMTFELTQPVRFTKRNVYTDTLRHGADVSAKGIELQEEIKGLTFDGMLQQNSTYLTDFWKLADVIIEGDEALQEGIRFNLYHLLQAAGKDEHSNIAAKGLSGEGYEGHYFWDTEIYMFPVFLSTNPELAKQLLIYRHSILEHARAHARQMGHQQGALYPWRTISGTECSSYYPSGSAQYHISADIAYSYIQYYLATKDVDFIANYGAEVLFETARLWLDVGHFDDGSFKIDSVTGPDEYTCIVNNNYYTNVMAKHNLEWAVKAFQLLERHNPERLNELRSRLGLGEHEVEEWFEASREMYLPYDEERKLNPQDDSFLQKAVWDFEATPKDHYPLLLHYHPLALYRHQVCKQADTVLAHFLLEDEQEMEAIKASYDYYENITTHDSSLSSCIFSIMAAKLGYQKKAYDYFIETARLDLDNTHGNTKDGLHMANMGGTWMAIVYGFGGYRLKETGISFAPMIPENWDRYAFTVQYEGRILRVDIRKQYVAVTLLEGDELCIKLYDELIILQPETEVQRSLS